MSERPYTVRTGWWREMRRGGQQVSIEETDILYGHERIACGITREWSDKIAAALNAAERRDAEKEWMKRANDWIAYWDKYAKSVLERRDDLMSVQCVALLAEYAALQTEE